MKIGATRGIRNNNPTNIRKGSPWQGLADEQPDADFCTFRDPIWGIRAAARIMITYQDKYKLFTLRDLITRWAPPTENDTEAYIKAVSRRTGFDPAGVLDVHTYAHMQPLLEAMILQESGSQPYTRAQIDKGLLMAGIEPPVKPSRTIAGSRIATAGIGLSVVTDQVQQVQTQLSPLVEHGDYIKYVFLGVALLGIGLTAYARWDDRRKGVNP